MRKLPLVILGLVGIASAAVMAVGFTYATSYYSPPTESYVFEASTEDNTFTTFTIGHYFHGGDGESSTPFLIANPTELRNLSRLHKYGIITTAHYYKLANDFTWSGDALEPIGTSSCPFKGNFDGDYQTIHGLKVSSSATSVGMFGVINGATIQKLVLSAPHLTCSAGAATYAGFVCGESVTSSSSITNVFVYGGTDSLELRAKMTSSNASTTINIQSTKAYLSGKTANVTLTTSGFIDAVDSRTGTTATKSGNPSSFSNTTKSFRLSNSEIVIG